MINNEDLLQRLENCDFQDIDELDGHSNNNIENVANNVQNDGTKDEDFDINEELEGAKKIDCLDSKKISSNRVLYH